MHAPVLQCPWGIEFQSRSVALRLHSASDATLLAICDLRVPTPLRVLLPSALIITRGDEMGEIEP